MNRKIDLTKGRLMVSHTIYPNGVRGEYYPPGRKILIPIANEADYNEGHYHHLPMMFSQIELTPRQYHESKHYKK